MKRFICPLILTVALAGCSKKESGTDQISQGQPAAPAVAPKPKPPELTKATLLDAVKRGAVNSLPSYLVVSDVNYEVVSSVDNVRTIRGAVTLSFLENTFRKGQALQYQNPSVTYQIQLLKGVKKKGDQVELPFSQNIDLTVSPLTVPLPTLDDYGNAMSAFPHCYLEGGDVATNAAALIQAAADAAHKALPLKDKYTCLSLVNESLSDPDTFNKFMRDNAYGDAFVCISKAFGDVNFSYKWNGAVNSAQSLKDKFAAHTKLVQPLLDEVFAPIDKIVRDAKAKDKACSDYLMNL